MAASQVIFLAAVVAFALYATRLRSTVTDRLVYIGLAAVGFVLVLHPDWSTAIAHLIGIGRGVDLIIYLFMVFSLFHFAANAVRMRQLDRAITALLRDLAVAGAVHDSVAHGGDTVAEDTSSL